MEILRVPRFGVPLKYYPVLDAIIVVRLAVHPGELPAGSGGRSPHTPSETPPPARGARYLCNKYEGTYLS